MGGALPNVTLFMKAGWGAGGGKGSGAPSSRPSSAAAWLKHGAPPLACSFHCGRMQDWELGDLAGQPGLLSHPVSHWARC